MAHKLNGIRFGPLEHCTHICVDMQRMFAEPTPWQTPWIKRVLPNILNLVSAHPAATVFTRFIPPSAPEHGSGTWRRYYERWPQMTLSHLGMEMTELMPELSGFIPPARLVDKAVYSPWFGGTLTDTLSERSTNTLVVSGGETDVCVLATVLGAVDHGYRVIIASDALCSSSDETHDALMTLYESRFSEQIEVATSGDILSNWQED
jgi:nicotinamidase-related amidase